MDDRPDDPPHTPPDNPPYDQADARWMTFAELATARGISKLSAAALVRRHGWRRQRDNRGRVIALVPREGPELRRSPEADYPPDHQPDDPPYIAAFETALEAIREAKDSEITTLHGVIEGLRASIARTEDRAARGEQEKDTLRGRLTAMQEQLADAHAALQAAESADARAKQAEQDKERAEQGREAERARADALREHIEALQTQLAARQEGVDATEAIRQAETMVDNLREAHAGEVGALKAERHRLATQIDGFATRADQAEARTDSLRARVDVLQRERDTARAEAQEAAVELRQDEAERRARGRWARLRAAWRGE